MPQVERSSTPGTPRGVWLLLRTLRLAFFDCGLPFGAGWPTWTPARCGSRCVVRVDRPMPGERVRFRATRWHAATSEGESRTAWPVRECEARKRAGARPRGERFGDEDRAPARVRAHVFVQHRPEEEDGVRIRPEHAALCEWHDSHAWLPRIGPVRTARGVAVADKRHERVRGDLELRGQHARVVSSPANVRTRCKKPVSLIGDHSSRPSARPRPTPLERGEHGRRQAGGEVDREAAVLDLAEPAEEEDDDVQR